MTSATALADLPERWSDAADRPRAGSTSAKLIGQLLESPVLDHKRAAEASGATQRSVYTALDRLVAAGVLAEITGGTRSRVWLASDVFDELDRLQARIGRRVKPAVT